MEKDRLKLEKRGPFFFSSFDAICLQKVMKKLCLQKKVAIPDKIHLISFS